MLFNSYIFIFIFLPLTLAGWYYLNSKKAYQTAKYFLAGMSLWFYGYFNVYYLAIILASILGNYLISFLMKFSKTKPASRIGLAAGLLLNLGLLFYFKYYNFFFENVNAVFHTGFTLKNILLPLGISFFTFQQISFIVDRCLGRAEHYPFADYITFVTFFPQLIAGPIVLYKEMMPQFEDVSNRRFHAENFSKGIVLFTLGLAKKVLLADVLALPVNYGFEQTAFLDTPSTLLVILAYTFEIYFDFSGYSDMAIGLGKMFGFELLENFNYPYISQSISEFWRRWHISLGSWFRDYLYIPLGGNRNGQLKTIRNLFIVWFLTGLWHGASWNFVLWGLYFGILIILEKLFLDRWLKQLPRWSRHVYALILILFGWMIFAFDDLGVMMQYAKSLFTAPLISPDTLFVLRENALFLILSAFACTPLFSSLFHQAGNKISWLNPILVLLALLICTAYLAEASFNPFLYFRF